LPFQKDPQGLIFKNLFIHILTHILLSGENMKELGYVKKNRMEERIAGAGNVSGKSAKSAFRRFFDNCKEIIAAGTLVFLLNSGVAYSQSYDARVASPKPSVTLPQLGGAKFLTPKQVQDSVINVLQKLVAGQPLVGAKDFPYATLNKLISKSDSLKGDLVIEVDMKTGKIVTAKLTLDDKIGDYNTGSISEMEKYLKNENKEISARLEKLKSEGSDENCQEVISLTHKLLENKKRLAQMAGAKSNLGHILNKDERDKLEKAICDVIKKNVGFVGFGTSEITKVPITIDLKIE